MKRFRIEGELIVDEELTHIEMLDKLFKLLKENGIHFKGVTKQIHND